MEGRYKGKSSCDPAPSHGAPGSAPSRLKNTPHLPISILNRLGLTHLQRISVIATDREAISNPTFSCLVRKSCRYQMGSIERLQHFSD